MKSPFLLFCLLLAGIAAAADPEPNDKAGTDKAASQQSDSGKGGSLEEAQAHEEAGIAAMQEANSTPSRIVDAAMEFTAALKIYEAKEDFDKCHEMNANIFWCKKKMNLEDLSTYLARKNNDKETQANYEKLLAVADKKVAPEEADAYFERAQKFAAANPEKQFLIAIRYFEVAERFVGSEVSIKAQKLSLEAQESHMRSLDTAKEKRRDTLFSHPSDQADDGAVAMPGAADIKDAQPLAKKLYKDELQDTRKQKAALAWKYCDTGKESKDEPAVRYALFAEGMSLAVQAGDVYAIIVIADECAKRFTGYDAKAEKKRALDKVKGQDAAGAAIKLLDTPDDPEANTKVGKFICLIDGQWDIGLPMLSIGSDKTLAKVADMEQEKPSGAMQEMEVGDIWYDLCLKAKSPYMEKEADRARMWYKKALPSLTAVSKQKVSERMDDLFGISPEPGANFNGLTAAQWDKLKLPKVEITPAKVTDVKISLKAGQSIRIIPHPTDTWKAMDQKTRASTTYTWKGTMASAPPQAVKGPRGRVVNVGGGGPARPYMQMMCWLDETGTHQRPGLLEGPGDVYIGCEDPFNGAEGGSIRVKLFLIEE